MAETGNILAWTLVSKCEIPSDIEDLLVEGEGLLRLIKHYEIAQYLQLKNLL